MLKKNAHDIKWYLADKVIFHTELKWKVKFTKDDFKKLISQLFCWKNDLEWFLFKFDYIGIIIYIYIVDLCSDFIHYNLSKWY